VRMLASRNEPIALIVRKTGSETLITPPMTRALPVAEEARTQIDTVAGEQGRQRVARVSVRQRRMTWRQPIEPCWQRQVRHPGVPRRKAPDTKVSGAPVRSGKPSCYAPGASLSGMPRASATPLP
jgi:hypothetical protein